MAGTLCSMTGFGRGEAELAGRTLVVELRALNSRHLDLRVRLPRDLSAHEVPLRELIGGYFRRGQVEVSLRLPPEGLADPEVEVDFEMAGRYAAAAERLRADLGIDAALPAATLLGLPGVVRLREPAVDAAATEAALRSAVEAACRSAVEMRQREGAALAAALRSSLDVVGSALEEIEARADQVQKGLRERFEKRVAALAPDVEVDPGRIEQEVVLWAQRLDVTEETVRARSHLEQFRETLEERGPVGRKLEFLLQELGREVNTIGSKVSDAPLTRCVVELKTELEKLREQVLNVE